MKTVKLGYVGCGFMAQKVHLPNFAALPGCELVALAEVREGLGRRVQKRFGIKKFYRHHLEMAEDREIDAFAVSAAFAVQGEIGKDLLRTGRPVFMEKPMAISIGQAEAILEAAQTPGARLMIGYMKRYDAGNELVKERVDQFRAPGELGPVTFARAHGFCGDWICSGLGEYLAVSLLCWEIWRRGFFASLPHSPLSFWNSFIDSRVFTGTKNAARSRWSDAESSQIVHRDRLWRYIMQLPCRLLLRCGDGVEPSLLPLFLQRFLG